MNGPLGSRFCLALTAAILIAAACILAARRPACCGKPNADAPPAKLASMPHHPSPTLAPPPNVVLLRAEADDAELEVGWAGL